MTLHAISTHLRLSMALHVAAHAFLGVAKRAHAQTRTVNHSAAAQVADEEIARVPGWLARLHCPDLCLSCHFCSPSGYLVFSHGMALPEALLQSVFSDYKQWSYEADFDGHEGVFYVCNATRQLNEEIGDLEQRVLAREVRTLYCTTSAVCMRCWHI